MVPNEGLNRRHALVGVAAVGVGLPVLAACGGDSEPSPATETGSDPGAGESASPGGEGSGAELTTTSEVPVGGGKIIADQKVVVTQPSAGEFKAFTAVCTHQQCLVSAVSETIDCSCHGSAFSLEDGSVQGGPAPSPLSEVAITVDGDSITLA